MATLPSHPRRKCTAAKRPQTSEWPREYRPAILTFPKLSTLSGRPVQGDQEASAKGAGFDLCGSQTKGMDFSTVSRSRSRALRRGRAYHSPIIRLGTSPVKESWVALRCSLDLTSDGWPRRKLGRRALSAPRVSLTRGVFHPVVVLPELS